AWLSRLRLRRTCRPSSPSAPALRQDAPCPQRLRAVAPWSVARKHPWMWSLITPTFCMNAYTLVGPTKRYPCDFSCFANASACWVEVGRSARDPGARLRVISYDFASAARLGDADDIARALSTVAWILPRLRMIEASC